MRVEEAVLDVASTAPDDYAAVAVLAGAVGSRLTTADRLLRALAGRTRIPRRGFLVAVLEDVRAGACSVLEREYLRRVERAHGLPTGRRQAPGASRGTVDRDVVYDDHGVEVELDGRLDHTQQADVDRDLDRDLDGATEGRTTLRVGWGQAVGRPCRTALRVGRVLQRHGWQGRPTRCPACDDDNR